MGQRSDRWTPNASPVSDDHDRSHRTRPHQTAPRHHHATPIAIRPLTRDHFPLASGWFAAPHVAPWWQEPYGSDDLEAR